MNVLESANTILLNMSRIDAQRTKVASQLSSGLRIQSAADDPSGLAIADTIQTKVQGLQQAVQNVQNGSSLLQVADGAAATIENILQRVNSLLVESASDLNSDADLQNIQTEIEQMLVEVNRIAANANFNGLHLFDGSHDTYVASPNAAPTVQQINPGANPNGTVPVDTVTDAAPGNPGTSNLLVQNFRESNFQELEGLFEFAVTGYSTNPTDPVTGPLGQPGVYVQNDEYSTEQNFSGGVGDENNSYSALPTNAGWDVGSGGSLAESTPGDWIGDFAAIAFDMPNLTQQDVGAAIAFVVTLPQQSGGGTAINLNDSGDEGGTVAISLPNLSASSLDVAGVSVLRPTDVSNFDVPTSLDSSNQYAVMDAQVRVGNALQTLGALRAELGAQMVSLQDNASDGAITIVNETAGESNIRDLDVATASTQFIKQGILGHVGAAVLAQMKNVAHETVNALFAA